MSQATPDEQHHFIGWSIERFGQRHFLQSHGASWPPIPSVRVEITPEDFRALLNHEISATRIVRKHDTRSLTRWLENPPLAVKIFLLASFVFIAAALVAVLAGWVVYVPEEARYIWKPTM